jgi:hypothetical protein
MTLSLRPRHGADTCARCRNRFNPGDRVIQVWIVQSLGRTPNAATPWDRGAWWGHEYEVAHVDCVDRALEGKVIQLS